MKILTAAQTRELDAYTIEHEPIASIDLMERASQVFTSWFLERFSDRGASVHIFCGMGNNGGDGLAIARLLQRQKYEIRVSICQFSETSSEDFQINLQRLEDLEVVPIHYLRKGDPIPVLDAEVILIDAIFGSGLNRPVTGYWQEVFDQLNSHPSPIVSVDIPSGLFADQPTVGSTIRADYSLTFEQPKLAFFFPENQDSLGEWDYRSIGLSPIFLKQVATRHYYVDGAFAHGLFRKRKKFDHKGTFGHAFLIAGSYGKVGAAILSARAVLRSGVGLLTVHAPRCAYEILQISVPEAMVSIDRHRHCISEWPELGKYQAIGIGPGIDQGKATEDAVLELIRHAERPLVLDADGLNLLAKHPDHFEHLPKGSILTPHPKEFERLFGASANSFERNQRQCELARQYGIVIVLKGAHTCVALPDGSCYFNSTGNPGMATGGSGDVLTGIITGLLAQAYPSGEAAILGVYLHGLAGDLAVEKLEHNSLVAGDLVDFLGRAFIRLGQL